MAAVNEVPESVLEKIKKLLELSSLSKPQPQDSPGIAESKIAEAAAYAAQAQRMLFKYHLSFKDIADRDLRQRASEMEEASLCHDLPHELLPSIYDALLAFALLALRKISR